MVKAGFLPVFFREAASGFIACQNRRGEAFDVLGFGAFRV